MKTHQCPICGSKRTFLDIIPQGYQYICTQCGLCALRQFTPQEAAEAWNELVFKFPPIMRLGQGDNVLIWLSDDIYTVLGTDLEAGKIHLQDVYGDADSYYPTNIKKWPWELNRKEGQQ